MDVDSVVARRERSPETSKDVTDERPSKKPRIEEIKPTTSAEASSKPQPKKGSKFNKRAMQKLVHPEEGTPDDVLWHEIKEILGESVVDDAVLRKVDLDAPLKFGDVLDLDVVAMSSNGTSMSL
jgi:tRNA (uracil-5-)-methyltransferase